MTGIIIGRFQVPYLHPGHLWLIATALRECDKVIVLLGIPKVYDDRNPYPFQQRQAMIKKIFPQVHISDIHDMDNDDDWSIQVDSWKQSYGSTILYHSRDSFKEQYKGELPLRQVEEVPNYSGTKLRKNINHDNSNTDYGSA